MPSNCGILPGISLMGGQTMGRIVIACYKPKRGKERKLAELMRDHVSILRSQGLATDRDSIIMKAKNRTIIEVFEWKSRRAIKQAHSNPVVLKMWERYSAVCDYVPV